MKKIFALILLLAVSLLAFTACSTITAFDVDYTKSSSYGCDCSFSVKISDKDAEYINYDLVFRSDKEVLHTEHVLKDAIGSADSDGYYTIDHYVSYPSELRDRYSEITDVTVENVEVWSQEGPKIAFILLTVAAGAATIVIIAVAAATRKRGAENK